mmetsp:Transcript_66387/g.183343  ORF Transcript_66387/g.183343 Transcript_66387/m.183343 type:complete len:250 (+) Transcript_66387:2298-3047(+)
MTVHTAMADGGAVVHFEVTALGEHVGRVRPYELSPMYASDRVSLPVTTPGARILRLADLTGGQWGDHRHPIDVISAAIRWNRGVTASERRTMLVQRLHGATPEYLEVHWAACVDDRSGGVAVLNFEQLVENLVFGGALVLFESELFAHGTIRMVVRTPPHAIVVKHLHEVVAHRLGICRLTAFVVTAATATGARPHVSGCVSAPRGRCRVVGVGCVAVAPNSGEKPTRIPTRTQTSRHELEAGHSVRTG